MVIFADTTQNIYKTDVSWTGRELREFPGQWTKLKGSYRFPPAMFPVLNDFYRTFHLELEGSDPPQVSQTELFNKVDLIWYQAKESEMIAVAAAEIRNSESYGYAAADSRFLTIRHTDGLQVLQELTNEKPHLRNSPGMRTYFIETRKTANT